jgi:hypothetical protein
VSQESRTLQRPNASKVSLEPCDLREEPLLDLLQSVSDCSGSGGHSVQLVQPQNGCGHESEIVVASNGMGESHGVRNRLPWMKVESDVRTQMQRIFRRDVT